MHITNRNFARDFGTSVPPLQIFGKPVARPLGSTSVSQTISVHPLHCRPDLRYVKQFNSLN